MNMESVAKAVSCLPELVPFKDKKGLWIFGESESKRRVIMIEKTNGSYGFTLQSYGVRYKHGNRETDFITYVNAVEKDGAAYYSGLREGDVILSINGQNMARVEHKSLVNFIRKCPTHLKMVVVSDERARKVELHMRYVHLQKKLHDKMKELEQLNWKEKEILGSPLGVPCLSAPTSSCCFCPPKTTKQAVILDDKEKAKTISTTTAVAATADKNTDNKEAFYYDCYRKSQSHRELHHRKDSKAGCMSGSGTTTTNNNNNSNTNNNNTISNSSSIVKSTNSGGESCNNNSTTIAAASCSSTTASQNTKAQQQSSVCDPPLKPKSWDNLMTTTSACSFGGYGYGYSPIQHSTQLCNHHPHHHHHHFNYNYSKNATRQSRQDGGGGGTYSEHRQCPVFRHAPFQIVTTGATIRPGSSSASGNQIGTSKTLPSSSSTRGVFAKMEKTLSDTSLNSEHHKDFPKAMRLLNRSSENVRYSDDDEYENQYKSTEVPVGHDIFV